MGQSTVLILLKVRVKRSIPSCNEKCLSSNVSHQSVNGRSPDAMSVSLQEGAAVLLVQSQLAQRSNRTRSRRRKKEASSLN